MHDSAQPLAHAQRLGQPGVGELQRKSGEHQDNKTAQQNQVLPALVGRHANHHRILQLAARNRLAAPDDRIVKEHRSDHQRNQDDVNQPHPAHRD